MREIIIHTHMDGTVRALFVAPAKKSGIVAVKEVAVKDSGFTGDFHTGLAKDRQILMVSTNVLEEFDLAPGSLFENLVVEGIDVMNLEAGQRLKIGDTVLEVTIPCEPCIQMERVQKGLKRALEGRRGMFARVVTTGTIRVGDLVKV